MRSYLDALWRTMLEGRAHRRTFWKFTLLDSLFLTVIAYMAFRGAAGDDVVTLVDLIAMVLFFVYPTVTLLPRLAVGVRRLHDTGRSGWWYLFALLPGPGTLVLIYWLAQSGDVEQNRFGPPPQAGKRAEGGFVGSYLDVLRGALFEDRTRRTAFWAFVLVDGVILAASTITAALTDSQEVFERIFSGALLYLFVTMLPRIAVAVRRLHDTGRSGWWFLLALLPGPGTVVLLYWFVLDSESGANPYGMNPKFAPDEV